MIRSAHRLSALMIAATMSLAAPLSMAQSASGDDASDRVTISEPAIIDARPQVILPPPQRPRDEVYDRASERVSPLSAEEIDRFRDELERKQDTINGVDDPPTTRSCMSAVSLASGAQTPVVDVAPGYVASVVFLDSYGNPWPISGNPAVGNPDLYSVSVVGGGESSPRNVLQVSARAASGATNLSVVLAGEGLPVQVKLNTNRDSACLRADMQVDSRGPGTSASDLAVASTLPAAPTPAMTRFVSGTPPQGASELDTDSDALRVWQMDSQIYVRTRESLVSPAWQAVAHGSAGVRVYRLAATPMILYTDGGNTLTARIDLASAE